MWKLMERPRGSPTNRSQVRLRGSPTLGIEMTREGSSPPIEVEPTKLGKDAGAKVGVRTRILHLGLIPSAGPPRQQG